MFDKKLGAAVLLCALAGSAFAEMGMYLKGGLGYTSRRMNTEQDMGTGIVTPVVSPAKLFGITAVFGIEPFTDSGNAFVRALSFEFSLDRAFGKGEFSLYPKSVSAFAVTPGVMAVYGYRFDVGLKPYGGVGFSVPIQRVSGIADVIPGSSDIDIKDSTVKVGFNVDMMAELAYEVTEKIAPYIEFGVGFGSSFAFDVRGGVMYRLGGGSSSSSGGGDSRNRDSYSCEKKKRGLNA